MAVQETLLSGKRRGPKPTGVGQMIGVRLQPEDLKSLDSWIAANGKSMSRPEAIRRLVAQGVDTALIREVDLSALGKR